ncbi:HD domain-containing protein [Biomaibacter acetigenes]|uniref:bis(5'-nucleosyl)-tetraphosphatase (symmetrical) n=1 Tax=Biomaibacter acetigenes TaxID=2316383 RepID=A0A3G2R9V2_9FIRM|nr:HD domain-containing protein [Biomaibacter acetigenes]RKL61902.1 HD domain-containing protein [Thermoanaerobacteraceae bacterium SP2]
MSRDEIILKLKAGLKESRFKHSLGVMETSIILARRYGADVKKAGIAGLIHDCARDIPAESQLKMVENFGILLDDIEKLEPALIHGPLGAAIARKNFGVDDEEILNAVRLHTTGDKNMTLLEKIIFLSDYIEPGRCFPGVEDLRVKAFKDLDEAMISAYDSTIKYVTERESLLHPRTVCARNFILLHKRREGKA